MTASRRLPLLLIPATLFLLAIYVWPSLGLFRNAFNEVGPTGAMVEAWSLETARATFHDSFTFELTLNSLWLSSVSTLIALCMAYPVSLFLFRTDSRFRGLLAVVAIMPMLVSGVVRVFGWLAILGDRGLVNTTLQSLGLISTPLKLVFNWTGVTIGLAESIMPYMILALLAGFGRLDRTLEEAARSLGASPFRTFPARHAAAQPAGDRAGGGPGLRALDVGLYHAQAPRRRARLRAGDGDIRAGDDQYQLAGRSRAGDLHACPAARPARGLQPRGAEAAAMTGAGRVLSSFAALVYVLILAPIVVVVMLAFSADNFILFPPSGYSLRWFQQLAGHAPLQAALWLSVQVAAVVTCCRSQSACPPRLRWRRGALPAGMRWRISSWRRCCCRR
jgi:ABC-type spermidine/putrescine transport system permease subunit I